MPKLVKFPRKPTRVRIDRYVLQVWDPKNKEWNDSDISYTGWPGGKANALNQHGGEIVRIVSRHGYVSEKVEAFWGEKGIERRPGYPR